MGKLPVIAKDAASPCAREHDDGNARLRYWSLCLHHVEQESSRTASSRSAAGIELTQQTEVSGHMVCSFAQAVTIKVVIVSAALPRFFARILENDTITKIRTVRLVV